MTPSHAAAHPGAKSLFGEFSAFAQFAKWQILLAIPIALLLVTPLHELSHAAVVWLGGGKIPDLIGYKGSSTLILKVLATKVLAFTEFLWFSVSGKSGHREDFLLQDAIFGVTLKINDLSVARFLTSGLGKGRHRKN